MPEHRVGIDFGSSTVKLVALNNGGGIVHERYAPHQGKPLEAAAHILSELPFAEFKLGLTGSGMDLPAAALEWQAVHLVLARIRAVRCRLPGAHNILCVGAGSAALIRLGRNGEFLDMTANSLCAAGTGVFLDEQSKRLGLSYADFAAMKPFEDPPAIATRCAVFAKSDLIHRQQEGCSIEAMWAGLCKGCADTFLQTLLKGRPLAGLTAFIGGVSQILQITNWLHRYYGDQIRTWSGAHLAGAHGAALTAERIIARDEVVRRLENAGRHRSERTIPRGPELRLARTKYPSFEVEESRTDELGNEVRVHRSLRAESVECFLGVDIGSTSTKLVLLGADGRVWVDIYRKTDGDPIGATQKLFQAVEHLMRVHGVAFDVRGSATTGSGRKFIGKVIGADAAVNEITCHVAGAMETDPRINTIFEIGGQDSKYMSTKNGRIRDANMNFICAAGTGSFVEEQAGKLGYNVREVGDLVMGVRPPQTSDRCTVFMQEDVANLLRQGYSSLDAMAAVMNSVVKNYLNKVVGNRPVSKERIFFQGATARNKGLVAAFENLLGVEMVVSPLCHQMGAYGAALLAMREAASRKTEGAFRGFDLARRKIELTHSSCDMCNNKCRITRAQIENDDAQPSWGYQCGKDPEDTRRRETGHYALFRTRDRLLRRSARQHALPSDAPTALLPRALTTYSHLPFWTALLGALGVRVKTTPETNADIKHRAEVVASGDFCFPMKAALGHAATMTEDGAADFLLIPQMISAGFDERGNNGFFCPYVQSYGGVAKSMMRLNNLAHDRLLTPVIDLRWDEERQVRELLASVGGALHTDRKALKAALREALQAQAGFGSSCREAGVKALAELRAKGERAIVFLGRPYNVFDPGINVALPEKIAEYGTTVFPLDFLPADDADLPEAFDNIYWNYGRRILSAAKFIAGAPDLFAVYLSNFNCGPDSFLLTYTEKIMGDKPMLVLELDAHGADAGYLTRVEAFLDVATSQGKTAPAPPVRIPPIEMDDLKRRTLWLPPMHPLATRLSADVFRRFGYRAEALPQEDGEAHETGRAAVRGGECLPAHLTIGAFLKKMKEINADPREHAFFMATADGPCRFGQYALQQRLILDKHGYADIPILSPSSLNSYQGLEERIRRPLWNAFMASDVLYKMACRTRPYEQRAGETDAVMEEETLKLGRIFREGKSPEKAVRMAARSFAAVPRDKTPKPLVGVVGEIYVRSNPFANGRLIEHIERYGGEAWLTPLSEWFLYTAHMQSWNAKEDMLGLAARGKSLLKNRFMEETERRYYDWCAPVLDRRREPHVARVMEEGAKRLPVNFAGESILTVGRAALFAEQGAALVVNAAPFGCMPGIITASLFQEMQRDLRMPVISQYFDGEGDINRRLEISIREAAAANRVPLADAIDW